MLFVLFGKTFPVIYTGCRGWEGVPEDLGVMCYIAEINIGVPPCLWGCFRFWGLGVRLGGWGVV